MARKPVDTISRMETRDALWAAIRAFRRPFTCRELQLETRCTLGQAAEYLKGLEAAGIVAVCGEKHGRGFIKAARLFRLVQDVGPVAPRVRRDGTPVTQGRGREQMWKAMRVLGRFTVRDLVVSATLEEHAVALGEAQTYCHYLHKAGYLTRSGELYQCVRKRYSGPRPPMIQRIKQVFDPNLNQVVWSQGGEDE